MNAEDFWAPAEPGEYRFRLVFHGRENVADRGEVQGLVVLASEEFTLVWRRAAADPTVAERARAGELFERVSATSPVVAWGRVWDPEAEYAGQPRSDREELWRMGYDALPILFEWLDDDGSGVLAKAWALMLLFDLTGQNDPREALGALEQPNLELFTRRWKRFRSRLQVGESK